MYTPLFFKKNAISISGTLVAIGFIIFQSNIANAAITSDTLRQYINCYAFRKNICYSSENATAQIMNETSYSAEDNDGGFYQYTDLFGKSYSSAGDLNNDGYNDVLIGEPGYKDTKKQNGRVLLYYGPIDENSFTLHSADAVFSGVIDPAYDISEDGIFAGAKILSSDINGDGFDDIIIGAPKTDVESKIDAGAVYIFYASGSNLFSGTYTLDQADAVFYGSRSAEDVYSGSNLGLYIDAAGDVNADGLEDLVMSDPSYPETISAYTKGKVYILYGDDWQGEYQIDEKAQVQIYPIDNMPYSSDTFNLIGEEVVGAGDINNDGFDDVIFVGQNTVGIGGSEAGYNLTRTYIYYGNPDNGENQSINAIDLSYIDGTYDEKMITSSAHNIISFGDINNDSYADIALSGPDYKYPTPYYVNSNIYIYYGPLQSNELTLLEADSIIEEKYLTDDGFANAMAAIGDVNADGFADLGIMASRADTQMLENVGTMNVIYGPVAGGRSYIEDIVDRIYHGSMVNEFLGSSSNNPDVGGDISGDGISDILIGSTSTTSDTGETVGSMSYWRSLK